MAGYEFQIAGGSDYCGFPMRKDLPGVARKKVLLVKGVGLKDALQGIRKRRTICGNTIHQKISQINLKVLKEGKEALVGDQKEEKEEAKKPKK
jgi:small subunit ribosomal protein S6e